MEPISILLVVMKEGSECCKLPIKTTEEDPGSGCELVNNGCAEEMSVDAAVLLELDGVLTLEEEETTALEVFPRRKHVFILLLTDFGNRVQLRRRISVRI